MLNILNFINTGDVEVINIPLSENDTPTINFDNVNKLFF